MNGTLTPDQAATEEQMLLNGPAGTPPFGTSSNLANPPNRDATQSLTTVVGLIRLYTKALIIRSFEYEDCTSLTSFL